MVMSIQSLNVHIITNPLYKLPFKYVQTKWEKSYT
jgi:hypothetical protein